MAQVGVNDESMDYALDPPGSGLKTIKDKLKQKEQQDLLMLYRRHGSTHKVAKELGINQSTVWRKLRNHINKKHLPSPVDRSV